MKHLLRPAQCLVIKAKSLVDFTVLTACRRQGAAGVVVEVAGGAAATPSCWRGTALPPQRLQQQLQQRGRKDLGRQSERPRQLLHQASPSLQQRPRAQLHLHGRWCSCAPRSLQRRSGNRQGHSQNR